MSIGVHIDRFGRFLHEENLGWQVFMLAKLFDELGDAFAVVCRSCASTNVVNSKIENSIRDRPVHRVIFPVRFV